MRPETIGKVCELCGTPDKLQLHHVTYDPEILQVLCVTCHQAQHPGHGVGTSDFRGGAKRGRGTISMELVMWTEIGKVSENETGGDVSAAVEKLCREALAARGK